MMPREFESRLRLPREVELFSVDENKRNLHIAGISMDEFVRRLGLTQQDIAVALGIHANTWAKWKKGTYTLPDPVVLGFALINLAKGADIERKLFPWEIIDKLVEDARSSVLH